MRSPLGFYDMKMDLLPIACPESCGKLSAEMDIRIKDNLISSYMHMEQGMIKWVLCVKGILN